METLNNNELIEAAKYALNVIAEFNAGGSIETTQQMQIAQLKLFKALKGAVPEYYGLKGE